jgi:hypothetical protein
VVDTTCTSILVEATGRMVLNFDDGSQIDFDTLEAAKEYCNHIDDPGSLGEGFAEKLLMRHWFVNDPTGQNLAFIVGKTVTFDMTAAVRIAITGS